MTKITKVADLIAILRVAQNGGQFAYIVGEHRSKFNQFPNVDYCQKNGITLAIGKGSKAINEQYRFNGKPYAYRFGVEFHFGQSYDRTLEKSGLTRSANGPVNEVVHFGSIAMGYPSTNNVCIIYMQGNYVGKGYFCNGVQVTDQKELEYIAGYKSQTTSTTTLEYRTIGVRNIRSITFGSNTYEVEIGEISSAEFSALCTAFGVALPHSTETKIG